MATICEIANLKYYLSSRGNNSLSVKPERWLILHPFIIIKLCRDIISNSIRMNHYTMYTISFATLVTNVSIQGYFESLVKIYEATEKYSR